MSVPSMGTGFLAGLACPACGLSHSLIIHVTVPMTIADSHVDYVEVESFSWVDSASCTCSSCNHGGVISDFKDAFHRIVVADAGDALVRLCPSPNAARRR